MPGRFARESAGRQVASLLVQPDVCVVPQSPSSFAEGLSLYLARPDKGYSLTDCTSMALLIREGITEVLSGDLHFRQEGFATLL